MIVALIIIVASVLFISILIISIMLTLRSSAAFRIGVERASHSPKVIALVGEPMRIGFLVRGGIRGGGRLTSLHARLRGPRGAGRLEIRAVKSAGGVSFDVLKFHSEGKVVDLLGVSAT
jgi:hypothetical protein